MRTKIIHVITGLSTGGAEMSLYKLLCASDHGEFEHVVVSLSAGDWPLVGRIRELGVPVHQAGLRAGLPSPVAASRFANLIRGLHPDLIQGWMYHGNVAAQIVALLLPSGTPVIWNICATQCDLREHKLTTALTILLSAWLCRWSTCILTDSSASARVHRRELNYDPRRWVVIPNGFELERFRPSVEARAEIRAELSLPPNTLLIGLIARYHAVKDQPGFLDAAALLRQRTPEAHFLLVGRGVESSPALKERVAALGLSGSVHLWGERADVPRILAALDIAVSASYSESFPNVVGEAMCCGVPCVVTDVGDTAYLVGDTGLVVPARNPAALAEACGDLVHRGSEGRQGARVHRARKGCQSVFAWRYRSALRRVVQAGAQAETARRIFERFGVAGYCGQQTDDSSRTTY